MTQQQKCSAASEDDPTANPAWNDGCDFAMTQLCIFLGVKQDDVRWDAATETVDGDVQAVIGNILRAKFGEDWGPRDTLSDGAQPVAWRYRHRGDPWSVCDTKPEEHVPGMLEVQPLYAAQPPAAPVETKPKASGNINCNRCGGTDPGCYICRDYPHHSSAATGDAAYRQAIDEALVTRHLGVAKGNARDELNAILSWEVAVALDPRVSEAAQALIDQGRAQPQTVEVTDAMVNAAAREMWNDRDARMGGPWDGRSSDEVCVVQTKATARAALTAALSRPEGK